MNPCASGRLSIHVLHDQFGDDMILYLLLFREHVYTALFVSQISLSPRPVIYFSFLHSLCLFNHDAPVDYFFCHVFLVMSTALHIIFVHVCIL